MQNMFHKLLLLSILLSACSAVPAAPQGVPSVTTASSFSLPTTVVPDPKPLETLATPHIEQPPNPDAQVTSSPLDPGQCGYQWAYQDLPELSNSFQQSIQTLQPAAQANVFAFGENCVRADGSATFIPMETDFNVILPVSDTTNESDLGQWIVSVMQVITAVPPEQIVGPRPGRVGITFQSSDGQRSVTFYINQYQDLPEGLSHAEVFQALQVPQ